MIRRFLYIQRRSLMSEPMRSVLYMPASNQRALEKSETISADGFIYDLEDAVAPQMKILARSQAVAAVNTKQEVFGKRKRIIRVNGCNTEWYSEDIQAAASSKCDAILLPKAETVDPILEIVKQIEKNNGNQDIWLMIETPKGVMNVSTLASAHPRVKALVLGSVDLANELRCEPSRFPLHYAMQKIILHARANQIYALDGVFINTSDEDAYIRDCKEGKRLGFDGRTIIHPKMADEANKAYSPSLEEVEKARKLIHDYEKGVAEGKGAISIDGELVEALHIRSAKRIIENWEFAQSQ